MAPSTIRKAIGTMKDQTSISIAKVASNMAPDLEVAIVKSTSHDDDPANEKYVREILNLISCSRGYVHACVSALSKRLGKTKDWVVALKALMLVHRLMNDGDPSFKEELMYGTRRGTRILNMSDFRDEAHSNSWDHTAFVKGYALFLDQKLELMIFERKEFDKIASPTPKGYRDFGEYSGQGSNTQAASRRSRSYGDATEFAEIESRVDLRPVTPLREMKPERIFGKMSHLQRLLDRFLSCRPTGLAKNSRMILIGLYPILKESFQLYADICDVLAVLLDKFFDMDLPDCVKTFDAYASAAKQIEDLILFYSWCKDIGVARSSEYPEVQRITKKLLETLEEFVRDRSKMSKFPEKKDALPSLPPQEESEPNMNEIKALPPPENFNEPAPVSNPEPVPHKPEVVEDLVKLTDDSSTAEDQEKSLALALFADPSAKGSWEAFPSSKDPQASSAWQNPAAEPGKEDWELALVESASHLSKQKAALGGGFDPLLLNGMYDQGIVTNHTSMVQMSGGSASSVALPGPGKNASPVLALPAPDGTVQQVNSDPFTASLVIPPPSYVQMADMEKKQHLLTQEQLLWQQYTKEGMHGQATLAKISATGHAYPVNIQSGMPPVGPPAGPYAIP